MKCKCGKGNASAADGICKFCREKKLPRRLTKRFAKHRGDGITYQQYQELTK